MKFCTIPISEAEGAILAHSLRVAGGSIPKGSVLDAEAIQQIQDAGLTDIVAARLEAGDIGENSAATRVARPLIGGGTGASEAHTGRVNLFATTRGLLVLDRRAIDLLNCIDESITLATLPEWSIVEARQIIATIKVIPYASPASVVAEWESGTTAIQVMPFQSKKVSLIQSVLSNTKESVLAKTIEATRTRLHYLGSILHGEVRVAHSAEAIALSICQQIQSGAEMVLICGASAIIDRRDLIPAGIEAAGGVVEHFGMPVDPGNLILVARLGDVPVLGLPGCARSPRPNGFDFVLQRVLAGIKVERHHIMEMGVGGLLSEIWSRPFPRAEAEPTNSNKAAVKIAAVILAAGRSQRMGRNKLMIEIGGRSLIRHIAEAACASLADPVIVVIGHEADQVRAALSDLDVQFEENPDFASGLSTSVKRGIAAVSEDRGGALICLGDMPGIGRNLLDDMISAFNPLGERMIVVPQRDGKRGNPVLWSRTFFPQLMTLTGDVGAKHLIAENAETIVEIEAADNSVFIDLDTPEALAHWRLATKPNNEN